MAQAKAGPGMFDVLSLELLDLITEKVQWESSDDFQALSKTSRCWRDSTKRCCKRLMITRTSEGLERSSTRRVSCKKSAKGKSTNVARQRLKYPEDVLSEELLHRPSLQSLVISKASYLPYWRCKNTILRPLSTFPWEEVQVDGTLCEKESSASLTIWTNASSVQMILSASERTLKKLTLTGFEFLDVETISEFLRRCPSLESLEVGGCACHSCHGALVQHDNLKCLAISGFDCPAVYMDTSWQKFMTFLSADCSTPVPKEASLALCLPNLQHLRAKMRSVHGSGNELMIAVPGFSFPRTLEVLDLLWCWGDSSAGRLFTLRKLYSILERDCPRLSVLKLQLDRSDFHAVVGDGTKKSLIDYINRRSEHKELPKHVFQLKEVEYSVLTFEGKNFPCVKLCQVRGEDGRVIHQTLQEL